jgi:hypothetical protein
MIRTLVFGLITIAATLTGVHIPAFWTTVTGVSKEQTTPTALDVVKLDPVSVPVIRGGKIEGYVIVRAAASVSAEEAKQNRPVLSAHFGEAVFRAIYEEASLDFAHLQAFQVAHLTERMAKLANERLGRAAIAHVMLENLNYVSKFDVRLQQQGRK